MIYLSCFILFLLAPVDYYISKLNNKDNLELKMDREITNLNMG